MEVALWPKKIAGRKQPAMAECRGSSHKDRRRLLEQTVDTNIRLQIPRTAPSRQYDHCRQRKLTKVPFFQERSITVNAPPFTCSQTFGPGQKDLP